MNMNAESADLRFIRTAAVIPSEGLGSELRSGHYVFFTDSERRTIIFNITASAVKMIFRERGIADYVFFAFDGEDIPEELQIGREQFTHISNILM